MASFAPFLPHLFPPSLELYQKSKNKSFWWPARAVTACRCCQLFFLWYIENAVAILKLFQLCGNVFCYQLDEYRVKQQVDLCSSLYSHLSQKAQKNLHHRSNGWSRYHWYPVEFTPSIQLHCEINSYFFISVHSEVLHITVVENRKSKRRKENIRVFYSQQIRVNLSFCPSHIFSGCKRKNYVLHSMLKSMLRTERNMFSWDWNKGLLEASLHSLVDKQAKNKLGPFIALVIFFLFSLLPLKKIF